MLFHFSFFDFMTAFLFLTFLLSHFSSFPSLLYPRKNRPNSLQVLACHGSFLIYYPYRRHLIQILMGEKQRFAIHTFHRLVDIIEENSSNGFAIASPLLPCLTAINSVALSCPWMPENHRPPYNPLQTYLCGQRCAQLTAILYIDSVISSIITTFSWQAWRRVNSCTISSEICPICHLRLFDLLSHKRGAWARIALACPPTSRRQPATQRANSPHAGKRTNNHARAGSKLPRRRPLTHTPKNAAALSYRIRAIPSSSTPLTSTFCSSTEGSWNGVSVPNIILSWPTVS